VSVVLLAGNTASAFVAAFELGAPTRLLGTLFGVVGLLPLYGFIRQRRLKPCWLWKALLVSFSVAMVLAAAICLYTAFASASAVPVVLGAAFIALGAPYFVALHQYIFRSPHLWQ
jgi:uncharacterized membrane protein HdeD (DUF308 family)